MVYEWRERKNIENKIQAMAPGMTIDALMDCVLLKFFQGPKHGSSKLSLVINYQIVECGHSTVHCWPSETPDKNLRNLLSHQSIKVGGPNCAYRGVKQHGENNQKYENFPLQGSGRGGQKLDSHIGDRGLNPLYHSLYNESSSRVSSSPFSDNDTNGVQYTIFVSHYI